MSFWCHFGALGGHLATRGAPGDPHRGTRRKNDEKGSSRTPPPGLLLGTLGRPWAPSGRHFLRFWVSGRRSVRRSPFRWPKRAAQEVPETPSNHETEGFAYTKTSFSHFHPYLPNDRKWFQWVPFFVAFRSFWAPWGRKVAKIAPRGGAVR